VDQLFGPYVRYLASFSDLMGKQMKDMIYTRNKKLLGAPGLTTRKKKLVVAKAFATIYY